MGLTIEQKRELKRKGSLLEYDFDGQEFMTYHNPKTGQEFPRLPSDSYNTKNYMRKGWLPGPASEELRKKWEEAAPEREAINKRRFEEAKKSPLYREMTEEKEKYGEEKFQESVQKEVQRQLEAAGISVASKQTEEIVEEAKEPKAPEQLRLFD